MKKLINFILNNVKSKHVTIFIVVVILSVFIISLYNSYKDAQNKYNNQVELYNSITDSLKTYKTKDSLNAAKIRVIQTQSTKNFLEIKNLQGTNLELQNLVKNKNKKIDDLTVALIHKDVTIVVDTQRVFNPIGGDTIIFSKSVLLDTLKNNWIDATYGFKKGFSYLDLKVRNQYNITIGYEGKTLFKQGIPYAEIVNLNPYTFTSDMRVYQISIPKPKRFGISFQTGFGGLLDIHNKNLGYGFYLGLGAHYNIIQW